MKKIKSLYKFVLSIGSNKNKYSQLERALSELEKWFKVIAISDQYEFECVNDHTNPKYLNQIAIIQTNLELCRIINILKDLEKMLGKIKTEKGCTIDIDVIFLIEEDDKVYVVNKNKSNYEPHIIVPCAELMPDAIHPEINQPFSKLRTQINVLY